MRKQRERAAALRGITKLRFETLEDRRLLATLIQHLDAMVDTSVETDAFGTVAVWRDQSGAGADATPSVGNASFPSDTILESGAPGVDFGADRNRLELFSAAESDAWLDQSQGAGGFAVIVAFEAESIVGNWNDLLGNSSFVTEGFGLRHSSSGTMQAYLGGVTIQKDGATAVTPGETVVYAFHYDAATGGYDFWDSLTESSTTGTIDAADFSLDTPVTLGSTNASGRYFNGAVGEVRVYEGVMTSSEFADAATEVLAAWSDPSLEGVLVIGPGETFILDQDATYTGIITQGDFLVADTADIDLVSDWVLVLDGGSFQVGSEESPFTHEFTLTLEGDDPEFDLNVGQYVPGSSMVVSDNNAFLMAMGVGSTIGIHADDAAKATWTQLTQTAAAGDSVLRLEEATGWEVGDRIAVASTDFDLNQAEEFTITAVADGGMTVTLDTPLEYMHYGELEYYSNGERTWELDMRAEVALLSRDVRIQGDEDSAVDRYGGHSMVMMGAAMFISGAEFTRMGQEGLLGRYPVHWHLIGDAAGQYVQNSSFHRTFNKGMTVHGTQNTLLNENVVYENIGHSYFFEDGAEFGNLITSNLAINTRASDSLEVAAEPSDFNNVASFWIENSDNAFYGNHAAGSEWEGFRFDLRPVNGLSADLGIYDHLAPHTKGPTQFEGNVAHSTVEAGLFITTPLVRSIHDEEPTADDQQLFDEDWGFSDFTSYKGNDTFWPRAIGGDFYDIKLAENDRANRLRLNNTLYDSLIVGRTGNVGTPVTAEEISAGRSLPPITGAYVGHVLYDGPGGLVDSHLDGFDTGDDAAIGLLNAVQKTSYHFTSGLTFGPNVEEANKVDFSRQVNGDVESMARALIDLDGSLTGYAGATVTQMLGTGSTINSTPGGIARPEWTAWVNPEHLIGSLVFDYESDVLVRHDIVRSDGAASLDDQGSGDHTQTGFIVDDQYTHTVSFYEEHEQIDLYVSDLLAGHGATFVFSDYHPLSDVTVYNPYSSQSWEAPVVDSLEELLTATTTSVYRGGDALTIRFVSEMAYGWMWPQPALIPGPEPGVGDYNFDGLVDDADLAIYRDFYGATSGPGLAADGNSDGVVNAADYSVWRNHRGAVYEAPPEFVGGVTVSIEALGSLLAQANTASDAAMARASGPRPAPASISGSSSPAETAVQEVVPLAWTTSARHTREAGADRVATPSPLRAAVSSSSSRFDSRAMLWRDSVWETWQEDADHEHVLVARPRAEESLAITTPPRPSVELEESTVRDQALETLLLERYL